MRQEWVRRFPLKPGIVMLNHASYGLATRDLLAVSCAIRSELEADPNVQLGEKLQDVLTELADQIAAQLGLSNANQFALTTSATSGAAALQCSIPLKRGEVVVVLDSEYSSVIRGWTRRCETAGAKLQVVDVPLPLNSVSDLLEHMTDICAEDVAILQFSAISSSAAVHFPVDALAEWGQKRGAIVLVDAAHAPFHVSVGGWRGVDASFGTLHKWLPVPRSVGYLWVNENLCGVVHPAETSLSFDEDCFARRFGWPGTFDPAARLALPDAVRIYDELVAAGEIVHCEAVADHASDVLASVGAVPTAGHTLLAPRMRSFLLPGVRLTDLRDRLMTSNFRAWTGERGPSASLLRVATNVYNDFADVEALAEMVRPLVDVEAVER